MSRSDSEARKDWLGKAGILTDALPFMRRYAGSTVVVKFGGHAMGDKSLFKTFASDMVLLKQVGTNPLVVHGGGPQIGEMLERMAIKSEFIDGLRVTDSETMEITEMVLTGKINSEVVSLINQYGGKAVGLSGKDANIFTALKRESKAHQSLGFVGDITNVDTTLIKILNESGYIPVISSVGNSPTGESLNMNADHVAQCIATAIKALKLIYLTDVQGLQIDDELQGQLTVEQAKKLVSHQDVKGGMLPKLTCSITALKAGVEDVHIINGTIPHAVLLELFTDSGIGTMIRA